MGEMGVKGVGGWVGVFWEMNGVVGMVWRWGWTGGLGEGERVGRWKGGVRRGE